MERNDNEILKEQGEDGKTKDIKKMKQMCISHHSVHSPRSLSTNALSDRLTQKLCDIYRFLRQLGDEKVSMPIEEATKTDNESCNRPGYSNLQLTVNYTRSPLVCR
jgi:hypothetical protein